MLKVLYKKSKTKKLNVWQVKVIEKGNKTFIEITRGQENGKMVVTEKEIKRGKGKKTIKEQALFEAKSKWNNKVNQHGYLPDRKKALSFVVIKPMLASKLEISKFEKSKIKLPAYIQPKLDGLRCVISLEGSRVVMKSRQMLEYDFMDHIRKEMKPILQKLPKQFHFDGELFTKDLPFERIAGLCRLKKELKAKDFKDMQKIQYHIYDCFDLNNLSLPYEERLNIINSTIKGKHIVSVETKKINVKKDIKENHDLYIKESYEGLMIRNIDSKYELDKRSKHLQKYKEFKEEEFVITSFNEGTGIHKGTVIWECKTKDGKLFKATPRGSLKYRKELFKNASKYIGKKITVIFQELTKDGIPRFPIAKAVRENY